jgi:hypothetical protein
VLLGINGSVLVGLGAFLAGVGSMLTGYAALKAAQKGGKDEADKTDNPPSDGS